ncbi:MAG TPA: hypothetical protein VG961_06210 [Ignavibacteria bacterium]|nr:hypothetical protein [Ignavibacteria bacterium]
MVKDRFLIIVIVFLFILNLFTLGYLMFERNPPPPDMFERERVGSFENDPHLRDKKGPDRPDMLIIDKLKLSNDQIKQFEDLKREHRRQIDLLQDSSRRYHDEYFGLLKYPQSDSIKANSFLNKIARNQIEIDKITYTHFEKIKAICDPDQKKLFDNYIDEIARSFKPPIPKK